MRTFRVKYLRIKSLGTEILNEVKKHKNPRKGFIIILLTMAVLILSLSATLIFFSGAFSEIQAATHQANLVKAKYLAQSGLEAAHIALSKLEKFGFFKERDRTYPVPFAGHLVLFRIEDLTGKFNLNHLVNLFDDSINLRHRDRLTRLSEHLKISPDIWDGVVDWIDENNTPEPYGYERSHYENLDPPRKIRNGVITSIEELLMIPGFTRSILFSDIRTEDEIEIFENSLESGEEKSSFSSDQFILANNLSYELSAEPINKGDFININTAPYLVILSLHKNMTHDMTLSIIRERERLKREGKKLSASDLKKIPGLPDGFVEEGDSESSDFDSSLGIDYSGDIYKITASAMIGSQVAQIAVTYDKANDNVVDYTE